MKVMVALDESEGSSYALNWVLSNVVKPTTTVADGGNEVAQRPGRRERAKAWCIWFMFTTLSRPMSILLAQFEYLFMENVVVYATSSVLDSVRQAQTQIASAIFARALHSCQEKKIKAETLALRGDPKEMLCRAAEERHVDLLVVGSRGLGLLKRAFLGSVSDYCAHHASCPVLIVKPPKEFAQKEAQALREKTT